VTRTLTRDLFAVVNFVEILIRWFLADKTLKMRNAATEEEVDDGGSSDTDDDGLNARVTVAAAVEARQVTGEMSSVTECRRPVM